FEGKNRLENVKELYSALEKFAAQDGQGSLKDFLDSASLVSDADNIEDTRGTLPLMTLHTCKGLEFEGVFIVGMENGLIPHASSMSDNEEYEEERRLCYVGFTRARKRLFLTNARRRRIYGSTFNYPASDFLLALPPETLEKEPGREVPGDGAGYAYSGNDRSATPPPSHGGSPGQFPVGAKVLHPAFGSGVVVQKEGEETDLRVVVFFKTAGKKKLAVNHANLIVL
ncbi:MAG: ATP-binding domain-containing protein, partial [Nitrospinae bacterium]|nr:ATP-binding domain-containing protein [Nitrospinota bacterium]